MLKKIEVLALSGQTQILALVNAVLGLLIAFNVVFTQDQLGAIDVVVNAVLAVVGAFVTSASAKASVKAMAARSSSRPSAAKKP